MAAIVLADFEAHVAGAGLDIDQAELAPLTQTVQQAPRFLLGEVPSALNMPMLGEFETGPIRCYAWRNARLGPDGALFDGHTALHSSMFNLPEGHIKSIVDGLNAAPPRDIRRIDERAVWLGGPGSRIYGHWLVDFLPRLLVLERCGYDLAALRYVVATPLAGFVIPMLASFGIRVDQLISYNETAEMVELQELLVVTNMRRGTRMHAMAREARDLLLQRAAHVEPRSATAQPGFERVFVARRDSNPSRVLTNRAAIEQIAVEAGFRLVQPELMSMSDQISLFRGVRELAGEYGSGLHSCMFSDPGTVTCAIRSTSSHPGFIQTAIAEVCGQSVGYVLAPAPIDAIDQAVTAPETEFRIALKCLSVLAASGG